MYNYNYHFQKQKEADKSTLKEDIGEFKKLKTIFNSNSDKTYKDILRELYNIIKR